MWHGTIGAFMTAVLPVATIVLWLGNLVHVLIAEADMRSQWRAVCAPLMFLSMSRDGRYKLPSSSPLSLLSMRQSLSSRCALSWLQALQHANIVMLQSVTEAPRCIGAVSQMLQVELSVLCLGLISI